MTRPTFRRLLCLFNWTVKGKRFWVTTYCDRGGAGLLVHRVRGDEWRYEDMRMPCLRIRAFWGEQPLCRRPRYGVEISLERWARDER
jgi:hypothetical protein